MTPSETVARLATFGVKITLKQLATLTDAQLRAVDDFCETANPDDAGAKPPKCLIEFWDPVKMLSGRLAEKNDRQERILWAEKQVQVAEQRWNDAKAAAKERKEDFEDAIVGLRALIRSADQPQLPFTFDADDDGESPAESEDANQPSAVDDRRDTMGGGLTPGPTDGSQLPLTLLELNGLGTPDSRDIKGVPGGKLLWLAEWLAETRGMEFFSVDDFTIGDLETVAGDGDQLDLTAYTVPKRLHKWADRIVSAYQVVRAVYPRPVTR